MKQSTLSVSAALLAVLFAAGNAQAQLKAPTPVPEASGPITAPPPKPAAPGGAPQGNPNVAQPNMPDPLSKEFRACVQKVQDAGQQSKQADPVAAQACFAAETKRQEGKVNTSTSRIAKALTPAEKKRFDAANSLWRQFRDAECAFFAEPVGNPVEAANNAQCVLDRTIKRALDIEGLSLAMSEREAADKKGGAAPAAPAAPAKK